MKDSEFLELLNLYLDHEISAVDAARLEAEVESNPKRREVYRQYCRMQKACKVLAAEFQVEEQKAETRVVVPMSASRSVWRSGFFVAGSVTLAAACLTLLFVARNSRESAAAAPRSLVQSEASARSEANVAAAPAVAATGGIVRASAPTDLGGSARMTLIGDSLVLSGVKQPEAVFVSTARHEADQLAWVRDFQLVSLQERNQLDQLRFESAPPTLRPEGRPLGGRAPAEPAVEMTAFRFKK